MEIEYNKELRDRALALLARFYGYRSVCLGQYEVFLLYASDAADEVGSVGNGMGG